MLQRSKAASSLLFAARAARSALSSSVSLAAAHRPASPPGSHEVDLNLTNTHPAGSTHAAIRSEASEVAAQTPACPTGNIDAASANGRRTGSTAQNNRRRPTTSPLTAAWHASHAAAIGAPHHHQHTQASPTIHVSRLHTSSAALAVPERVECARYVDDNPPPPPHNSSGRDSSSGIERPFQDIQEIAAVYDGMRDALRQASAEDENLEVREVSSSSLLACSPVGFRW